VTKGGGPAGTAPLVTSRRRGAAAPAYLTVSANAPNEPWRYVLAMSRYAPL